MHLHPSASASQFGKHGSFGHGDCAVQHLHDTDSHQYRFGRANDIDGVDVPYDVLSLGDMILYVINKYAPYFFLRVRTLMSFPQCHRRRISRTFTVQSARAAFQSFQIYRCYCVWNFNVYVIIVPMILLVISSGPFCS
jgi:hypothetical protein